MLKLFKLMLIIAFSASATACINNDSWFEPLPNAYRKLDIEWIPRQNFVEIDPNDRDIALSLLKDKHSIRMTGADLKHIMRNTGQSVDNQEKLLLLRGGTSTNGAGNAVGFYNDAAYSVTIPLGVCAGLRNEPLVVKSSRRVKQVHVVCAPVI